ncbi:hypothetical protein C9374_009111 [Naegleria lovaniensis]|uniref:Uncharacterized protein n=1 Tax=Naegleria lovaniensis TaxID=51637 RepID=A0AA88GIA5_NAELO|nr:uncharacterized protein C9374_009111 [Naegleria lovaniensis]KAG2377595.1 hypothetical protein C9374_009111 [Naegleria lovaniensis]
MITRKRLNYSSVFNNFVSNTHSTLNTTSNDGSNPNNQTNHEPQEIQSRSIKKDEPISEMKDKPLSGDSYYHSEKMHQAMMSRSLITTSQSNASIIDGDDDHSDSFSIQPKDKYNIEERLEALERFCFEFEIDDPLEDHFREEFENMKHQLDKEAEASGLWLESVQSNVNIMKNRLGVMIKKVEKLSQNVESYLERNPSLIIEVKEVKEENHA